MDLNDVKILTLNAASLAISFSNLESALKIILLIVSIGYTGYKWYQTIQKNEKNK